MLDAEKTGFNSLVSPLLIPWGAFLTAIPHSHGTSQPPAHFSLFIQENCSEEKVVKVWDQQEEKGIFIYWTAKLKVRNSAYPQGWNPSNTPSSALEPCYNSLQRLLTAWEFAFSFPVCNSLERIRKFLIYFLRNPSADKKKLEFLSVLSPPSVPKAPRTVFSASRAAAHLIYTQFPTGKSRSSKARSPLPSAAFRRGSPPGCRAPRTPEFSRRSWCSLSPGVSAAADERWSPATLWDFTLLAPGGFHTQRVPFFTLYLIEN